jgi:dipeptide transport system substrate-binding protein
LACPTLRAKATTDPAERTALYEQAQVLFKQEEPVLTLAHSKVFMPMNKKVLNYTMSPLGTHSFVGVSIAE